MLVYRGYLHQKTGYALASHMDVLALEEAGAEFKTSSLTPNIPRPAVDLFGQSGDAVFSRQDNNAWRSPGVQMLRCIPTDAVAGIPEGRSERFPIRFGPDQRAVCATVFEAARWPVGWAAAANAFDALVLPGQWLADAALEAGVQTPIHVVPHALEWPSQPGNPVLARCPDPEAWWERPTGEEEVRVLFEGTYMLRKNIPGAVEAFYKAFKHGEAHLHLHTYFFDPAHRGALMVELYELRRRLGLFRFPAVTVSSAFLTWPQLWQQFWWLKSARRAGVYLSLAYAEGVGYPLIMAAGLGLPVVCTDHPGHRDTVPDADFVRSAPRTPAQLWPLDPLATQYGYRIAHIHDDDPWARPDPEHAAALLAPFARENWARERLDKAESQARQRHSPLAVGKQLLEVVQRVEAS